MKKNMIKVSMVAILVSLTGCTKHASSLNPNGANEVSSQTVSLDANSRGRGGYKNGGYTNGRSGNGRNSVHFAYDSNKLSSRDKNKIAREAYKLKNKKSIKIEGNSDEFGTDEYNYALGLRRAKAVKQEMVDEGISAKRIKMISYGESNPDCKDKTKKCYQKNRRADYK